MDARVRVVAGAQGPGRLEVVAEIRPAAREERLGRETERDGEDADDEEPEAAYHCGAARLSRPASPGSA